MDRASDLSSAFAAGLGGGGVMPEADPGATIAALFEAGQAAFPAIAVEATALARYLGERCSAAGGALPPPSLAADVYLACACVLGVPGAHAAFEREFSGVIARAAARVEPSPAFADDLRQVVLEGLFSAPPSATPKIAEYAGRAPLRTFLRVIAVRTAINLRRRKADRASTPLDEAREIAASVDVEAAYLEARYKAEFEEAVRVAMGRLSPKQRALLRLHLLDGLSIDVLGAHYQVGRATAARWLAAAREALREGTRAELVAKLGLTESQYASLARLIRGRLDVSVASLLRE
ncbi:sigma-70 family RNA polymerase sigma factor [Sorangium sp. So ce131]|uniref:sigma-70 family RNA polymerase sigma factor n=1 Tax=Sorangium sp. So ce131 TaxID=3133282 RepID=UPI003F5FE337